MEIVNKRLERLDKQMACAQSACATLDTLLDESRERIQTLETALHESATRITTLEEKCREAGVLCSEPNPDQLALDGLSHVPPQLASLGTTIVDEPPQMRISTPADDS